MIENNWQTFNMSKSIFCHFLSGPKIETIVIVLIERHKWTIKKHHASS